MIFPQRMQRLTALVLKEDADELTRRLLNLGVMDFIDIREIDSDISSRLAGEDNHEELEHLKETRSRVAMFMETGGIEPPKSVELDAEKLSEVDLDEIDAFLDRLAADIQRIRDEQQAAQQEINRIAELRQQVDLFSEISELSPSGAYADAVAGTIGKSRLASLKQGLSGMPVYLHTINEQDNELQVLLIHMRRDAEKIGAILDRVSWKTIDIPPELRSMKPEVLGELEQREQEARKKQKELSRRAKELITAEREYLEACWKQLTIASQTGSMQSHYGMTAKTVLVTGWIPSRHKKRVEKALEEAAGERCWVEWTLPETDRSVDRSRVPVQLEHSRHLAPFQWLVENYSMPQYGTIDPTALVVVTYLAMFGLMFADAGHGAVLVLSGMLVLLLRKQKRSSEELREDTPAKLARLIIWCGGAAIAAGVLFGSYFGTSWLPPLWFDYHSVVSGEGGTPLVGSIYDILGITIKFGIGVITLGIILNCTNRIRSRQWFHLLFDTGGLLGGWFYAGGLWAGFFFVSTGYTALPDARLLFPAVGLPLLLFAAKAPAAFIIERKKSPGTRRFTASKLPDFIMDWIVELLELFTGYLSNTLSFMRIAGLGIAHVSLMTAFFQIAESTGSFWGAAAVLILGNAVVIVLEGLSAGIQSLRLHYYEFFTKYFCGSGRVYRPISLRRVDA